MIGEAHPPCVRVGRGVGTARARPAVLAAMLLVITWVAALDAREIVDMRGRRAAVPDVVKRVYSSSPPVTFLMTAVDPLLLVGVNFPLTKEGKRYLPKELHNLPVLGGFFGRGQTANIEMIMKSRPDLILTGGFRNTALNDKYEESLRTLGIPIVFLSFETLSEYPEALAFLGKVLNREERTKRLAAYCSDTLNEIAKSVRAIPASRRPTIYYAEDTDGLSTECTGSPHAQLIDLTGGKNVHRCKPKDTMGMEAISLEKVILYNPDVIIVKERAFYDKVFKDPRWRLIKAVRTARVYLIPSVPFNWFDRPPSFMRFIGVQWLMGSLYPDDYRKDIVKEARAFYGLFLGVNPTEDEMRRLIYP